MGNNKNKKKKNNICYHRNKGEIENMFAAEMDFVSVVGLV